MLDGRFQRDQCRFQEVAGKEEQDFEGRQGAPLQ